MSFCLQCLDCTSAALAATKILKKLAQQGSDADEAESMRELATHYEKRAIGTTSPGHAGVRYVRSAADLTCVCVCVFLPGVFTECHNSNTERAQKLLVRASPYWGKTTCLRLALEADDKNFVAHSGVQVGLAVKGEEH